MRDIVVTLFFLGAAAVALRKPYYGALLWVWVGLMNPHRLGWGFAYDLPFGLASVVLVALGILFSNGEVRWQKGAPITFLILLMLWMAVTTVTSIVVGPSVSKYIEVLKVFGMTLMVGALVSSREQIMGLIWVVVGSIAFFGFKGGIFTISTGGQFRVWGPPSSLVNGNNELALALIICIPLLYFLANQIRVTHEFVLVRWMNAAWLRRLLLLTMVLCAIAAIGSQSRGALLAVAAMGLNLWWHSRSKGSIGVVLLLLTPAILFLMPEEWMARMRTIGEYDQDLSALGRINAWEMAINIANDRLFGAGFTTAVPIVFQMYAPNPEWKLVAHSIYFQVLGEHGYIGLILYLGFWFSTYRCAGRLAAMRKHGEPFAWVALLGSMSKVSMIGFAVGGAFLSLAYWDMPFYLMVILVASERYAKEQLLGTAIARTDSRSKQLQPVVGAPRAAV